MSDQQRYRARSLWLDGALAGFTPRPQLTGSVDVDVAIVGAGYTGLWTAYALTLRDPGIRIAIVEAETVGYGASGRNGGFVSAGIAGEARVYERSGGRDGIVRAERAMIDGIDWVGEVVAREAIECGWVKAGAYRVATSAPQLARAKAGLEGKRARGYTDEDGWFVTAAEIESEVRVAGAIGEPREVLMGGYLSWQEPVSGRWFQATFFGAKLEFRVIVPYSGKGRRGLTAPGPGSGSLMSRNPGRWLELEPT